MSKQLLILSPQRGITVNREQMEAHLTLHGWEPFFVGQAAALKDGMVVYAVDAKHLNEYDGRVDVRNQTLGGLLHLLVMVGRNVEARRANCWYMSDKYFWPMAHRCVELDNQGKT